MNSAPRAQRKNRVFGSDMATLCRVDRPEITERRRAVAEALSPARRRSHVWLCFRPRACCRESGFDWETCECGACVVPALQRR